MLYEKAQSWDKAAAVYIKLKNWSGITLCCLELHDYICMPCTSCPLKIFVIKTIGILE